MDQKDLNTFRQMLLAWREELLREAGGAVVHLTEMENYSSDPSDRATFEESREYLIRIRDRESRLIRKINDALDRIADDTYGICDMCGEEIAMGRLKARPVTTYCISCKILMETREKYFGT